MARSLGLVDATPTAARQRLRPLLMTSPAFGMGLLPLALASAAGPGAQRAIGAGMPGGMVGAGVRRIDFAPLCCLRVRRPAGRKP